MSQRHHETQHTTLPADSLLAQIISETNLSPEDDGYEAARLGIGAFIEEMLKPVNSKEKVRNTTVDKMITDIDRRLSAQMNEILHDKQFQSMESAWRGLKLLIDRTDFRENVIVEFLNVTKDELLDDFLDAPEIPLSNLYKHVYTAEYGQFGGKPVGTMIGNYYFEPTAIDMRLLQNIAAVATMAHAPFLAAAAPEFFGLKSFERLPALKDLHDIFSGTRYTKWQAFRESEDARYVGLTVPRFLLRQPYDPEENPVRAFVFKEDVDGKHENFLWGNTAFAFATRITESFAKYRWAANIIGPRSGGAVEDLPVHLYEALGDIEMKIPTEVLISDRREYELAEQGFIALTMRKGSDNAAFFSANSCQKAKYFGISEVGKNAELNYRLGTQLPYLFIVTRLAHYIKVLQREHIGSWKERVDLERELNTWLRQFVADQENPSSDIRSRRPLRDARITVEDVEGDPGWYRVNMSIRPHFKYMGAYFTLSLVGKLEKA
jgi:type VI secretion system protein ImpC